MRPTVFLGHMREDGSPWSERDRELARALLMYEALKCPGCGQPRHESTSGVMEGWYDVDEVVCHGCAAKNTHIAGVKDPVPGAAYVVMKSVKAPTPRPPS